jgi:hypothetical protein
MQIHQELEVELVCPKTLHREFNTYLIYAGDEIKVRPKWVANAYNRESFIALAKRKEAMTFAEKPGIRHR